MAPVVAPPGGPGHGGGADGDEPAAEGGAAAEVRVRLSAAVSGDLEAAARARGVTLNTLTQAALGLVLSRYTARREVVFGVTVAGRPGALPGVETAVGLFINTLPLRLDVDPTLAATDFLHRVQERSAGTPLHAWSFGKAS